MDWSKKLKVPFGKEKYWAQTPGKFVNVETGKILSIFPYTGTALEWYKSLVEMIYNTSNELKDTKYIIAGKNSLKILQSLKNYKTYEDKNGKQNKIEFSKKRALPIYSSDLIDKNKLYLVRADGVFVPVTIIAETSKLN